MRHIPNIISILRIALIPFFVWQMLREHYFMAAGILVVSGVSDFLDGFLARRNNWISGLGKVLDPTADKMTQGTVYVMLWVKFPRYWFFFALLLFKELVMLTLGAWLLKKRVHIEGARWFGKVVTIMFYLVTASIIFFPGIPGWAVAAMLAVITMLTFAAGAMYIPQFRVYRKEAKK